MNDQTEQLALIMKGGGIKGLAYVGAVKLLREHYDFNWYVGTSAGAITAILLAAGYSLEELEDILREQEFQKFFDAKTLRSQFRNFILFKGLHRAQAFTDWMDGLLSMKIRQKSRVTLYDIERETGNRVTVYASTRGKSALTFDSRVGRREHSADAAFAARCSMSIPYVFTPQQHQGIRTYDGGIQNNYPIEQVLKEVPESQFVGLYLGPEVYEPVKESLVLFDLLSIALEGAEDEIVDQYRSQTVIIDPRPIGTLDFELSEQEKRYLLVVGELGAVKHLALKDELDVADLGDSDSHNPVAVSSTEEITMQYKERIGALKNEKDSLRKEIDRIREERKAKKDAVRARRRTLAAIAGAVLFIGLAFIAWAMVDQLINLSKPLWRNFVSKIGLGIAATGLLALLFTLLPKGPESIWSTRLKRLGILLLLVGLVTSGVAISGLIPSTDQKVERVLDLANTIVQSVAEELANSSDVEYSDGHYGGSTKAVRFEVQRLSSVSGAHGEQFKVPVDGKQYTIDVRFRGTFPKLVKGSTVILKGKVDRIENDGARYYALIQFIECSRFDP